MCEFHPLAADEVEEAVRWYADRSLEAALNFEVSLDHALERILSDPESFPRSFQGARRCRLRGFPYLLIYRQTDQGLRIYAVAHEKREPGYWRRRLEAEENAGS